jgi:rhomboid family GlyGly-CTERM serine protease
MIESLRYDRVAVLNGEIWRIFTGVVVHLSAAHFVLNLISALALVVVARRAGISKARIAAMTLALITLHGAILLLFTRTEWVAGFSGILHGAIVWAGLETIRRGRLAGAGVLLGIALKLAAEQAGVAMSAWTFPIAVDSHLAGAIAGGMVWALRLALGRKAA